MNENRNKQGNIPSNPQNRLGMILIGIVGAIVGFFLLSYIFSALDLFGGGEESRVVVEGSPNIESIPGVGDPSVEYSRLIADQNQANVEKAEKEGGSSLPTVIRPQYSLNTDSFNDNYTVKKDKDRCSLENLIKARKAGVSARELRCYGCSAEDLRRAGYGAAELKAAGFSAEELRSAGYSASELRAAGYSAADLKAAGFSAEDLLGAGYSVSDLLASGFTPKELLASGASVASLRAAGVDINALLADGVNASDMIKSGYCASGVIVGMENAKQLRKDGVTAAELYEGGASITDLLDYGYSIKDVLELGVTVSQMLSSGVSASDLRGVGVPKKDISFAEKNLSQVKGGVCTVPYASGQYKAGVQAKVLWPLGCQAGVLREAGYTARDLVKEGVTPGQMRAGGYSASNLVAAGVQLSALVHACYSIDSLLEAGFTAGQLAEAGIPVADLLSYGFSPTELAASGVNCAEMYKAGVALTDLFHIGCNADQLKAAGASAAELLNAGYSVGDLRAAGYSVEELLAAGASVEDLLAAGVDPEELMAAGVTTGQLLRAGVSAEQIAALLGVGGDEGTIGCSVERVTTALASGSTVADLLDRGCSVASLVKAGISTEELLAAGVSVGDLLKAGVTVSDLIAAGVSPKDLMGIADARDLYLAGVSLDDIKGYTLDQLRAAGYNVPDDYGKTDDSLLIDNPEESDLEKAQRLQNEALEKQDRERKVMQLSNAMQAQASALFASWDTMPKQSVSVSGKKPEDFNGFSAGSVISGQSSPRGLDALGPVVKAGTVMYAIMDNTIDSDDPTPVRATIASGPLKGAKILGSFEVAETKLVLKFDKVNIASSRLTKDITLFAVDVNTARNVSVDGHYLLKYGSLFASSFLEGMNEVASKVGTSVTTDGSTVTVKEGSLDKSKIISAGLGKVGENLVVEAKKFQNKPVTIRMQSGATFGIIVMEDFIVGVS